MRFLLLSFGLFFLMACSTETLEPTPPAIPAPPTQPLQAGTGEALIDLPIGHSLAGYMQTRMIIPLPADDPGSPFADLFPASQSSFSPPKAKAVLLDDGVTTLAMVRIDAIFTTDVLVAHTVALARELLDLELEGRLIVSATHTHGGGGRIGTSMNLAALRNEDKAHQDGVSHGIDTFNPESVDRMARSIVSAIGQAQESMQPAALGYARGRREDANRDRRCEDEGTKDDAVRLIRVDAVDEGGQPVRPIALLVNFAIHGTVYGGDNRHLTTDVPAFIEYKLEERFDDPVTVMFIQGTAGDISPGGSGSGSQRMEDVGYRVAEEAYRLHEAVTGVGDAEVVYPLSTDIPLQVKSRRIPISHSLLEYYEGEFHEDGAMLCQVVASGECLAEPIGTGGVFCLSYAMEGEGKYHTDIVAASMGPLSLITLPGEAVSEIGAHLLAGMDRNGGGELLLVGYAQDHNGYILMPDDWLRGGYEPTISYWGWRFAPYLLEQQLDLLRELQGEAPKHLLPEPDVEYPSLDFEPVRVAASVAQAGWVSQPGEGSEHARLSAVDIVWTGGDAVLGLPHVTVERQIEGEWVPLRFRDWREVSNTTYEIVTAYGESPTYRESPHAPERMHQWSARWEIPPWVPIGTYRFRIRGTIGTRTASYDVTGNSFEVTPTALSTQATCHANMTAQYLHIDQGSDRVQVRLAAFYAQAPYAGGGHQSHDFRLFTERGTAAFPHAGTLAGTVAIYRVNGVDLDYVDTLALEWRNNGGTDKLAKPCPGDDDLPHLFGEWSLSGVSSGTYRVVLQAGDVVDAFGNPVNERQSGDIVVE